MTQPRGLYERANAPARSPTYDAMHTLDHLLEDCSEIFTTNDLARSYTPKMRFRAARLPRIKAAPRELG